jgi:hypothetical protein
MGNTFELICNLEVDLCFITTDTSFSILLLASVDADYCFMGVVFVATGKFGNSNVFKNSNI